MSYGQITQQYNDVAQSFQSSAGATASAVFGGANAVPIRNQGALIANNDAASSIYLGFSSGVTPSSFAVAIPAGATYEALWGPGVLGRLFAVTSGASVSFNVTVLE